MWPFRSNRRPAIDPADSRDARTVRARYDAAQNGNEVKNIWSAADSLDAASANSLSVRQALRNRARYERANNGFLDGILDTYAAYVVSTGPTLRMSTGSPTMNRMVEDRWEAWALGIGLSRKLRTMAQAKVIDGEAFALQVESKKNDVGLNLDVRECDWFSAAESIGNDPAEVDGVRIDAEGDAVSYEVLSAHPGGSYANRYGKASRVVKAEYVCHWFRSTRAGQVRGVPEVASVLNLFATSRRFREAVVAAAETAADLSAVLEMAAPPDDPDYVRPFATVPIEKRTLVATPAGARLHQFDAKQPTATYESFVRSQLSETARPLSMSYPFASGDYAAVSFSGGRLGNQSFGQAIKCSRDDCELLVLNKVFSLWFRFAIEAYGWSLTPLPIPAHGWSWPGLPQVDDEKTARARETALKTGSLSLGRLYAEDGLDWEDEAEKMAREYGLPVAELKRRIVDAIFPSKPAAAPPSEPPTEPPSNGASANGRRFSATA